MKCPMCGAENPNDRKFCGDCGSILVPSLPVQPVQAVVERPKPPYQIKVNLYCLVGAIMGVLTLFMPWALLHDTHLDETTNVGAFDFNESPEAGYSFPDNFQLSVTLFVIGTGLAFILPIGGVFQFIGSMGFILTTVTYPRFGETELIFWIGAAIALISSCLVMIGLVYPNGVGFRPGKRTAIERLLTVSLFREPSV